MSKFTPGPWYMEAGGNTTIYGPDGVGAIGGGAFVRRNHDESWANLRLAAAAPDLLEALRGVVALSDRKHEAWDAAKAAIARATGESQ